MKVGALIIKTIVDNSGMDKGLTAAKGKAKLAGEKISKMLGNGLKSALNLGKGLASAFTTVLKTIVKVGLKIAGIGLLLGGLIGGIAILGLGFKKAFESDEVKANLDYIRFAIIKALEPATNRIADIISKIINMLFKVMQYIQIIVYSLTGKNIFENATVDAYADSIKKANKNAKELKKTLQTTGFDEMEVLQDKSGSSSGTSSTLPTWDLSQMPSEEMMTGWMKWILANGPLVADIIKGIILAIVSFNLADLLQKLGLFANLPLWQIIAGVALTLAGLIITIKGIIAFIKDPSWENFLTILEGIALVVAGIAILCGAWVVALAAVGAAIVAYIIKNWDKVKEVFQKGIDWLKEKVDWVREKFGDTAGRIYDLFVGNLQGILNWFSFTFANIKAIFNDIISFVKNVFTGNWKGAFENLKDIVSRIFLQIQYTIESIFKGIVNFALAGLENGINWPINKINGLVDTINKIPGVSIGKLQTVKLPRLAKGTILNSPGKGVPVANGRAIAGESGREAYLPLSDEQLLEELGSSIGRHVTINLTNITEMNGRILSREIQKIKNEDDFAFNR